MKKKNPSVTKGKRLKVKNAENDIKRNISVRFAVARFLKEIITLLALCADKKHLNADKENPKRLNHTELVDFAINLFLKIIRFVKNTTELVVRK